MKHITGKIALITGGGSGIGRLIALDLASRGANVAIWDLNPAGLAETAAAAEAAGKKIFGQKVDVGDRAAVYAAAAELAKALGPVDVLVNCAGVVSGKPFLDIPDEKIELTLKVNTAALFWTAKAFLPGMIERDSGHVVTIASAAGLIGVTGLADYSASKFAAVGFDESLRAELKRRRSKVRTTIVCPFFIDTGMFAGVSTRVPLLLPILKPAYVCRRVVKALLKDRPRLVMPRFVYATYWLRGLPVGLFDFLADLFGISRSMDHFTGRQK
jgi:all-trans-retinol dehydrogenase (NAD+)